MEDFKQDMANVCLRQGKKLKVRMNIPFEELENTKNLKADIELSCVDN